MDFLTRGDAVTIFGRRIPVSMLAVAATLLAAYMVMRARNKGGNLASVGTPVGSAGTPGYSSALGSLAPPSMSSTYDPNAAAISQLQQSQQDILSQLLNAPNVAAAAAASTPPPSTPPPPATVLPAGLTMTGAGLGVKPGTFETVDGVTYEELPYSPGMGPGLPGGHWLPQYLFQPASGVFQPLSTLEGAVGIGPGTPIWEVVPSSIPVAQAASSGASSSATSSAPATGGKGGIRGARGTVSAWGWTHRGPVRGQVRHSAFRHSSNPFGAAA